MHHISHIIATTDFSTAAERAVQRAALIAQQLGAKLHLLHVVHPLDMYPGPELSFDAQLYYREQILQEVNKNQTETGCQLARAVRHSGSGYHAYWLRAYGNRLLRRKPCWQFNCRRCPR
ncbi:MAG: universal stress protein [Methylophilaceae bacterium]